MDDFTDPGFYDAEPDNLYIGDNPVPDIDNMPGNTGFAKSGLTEQQDEAPKKKSGVDMLDDANTAKMFAAEMDLLFNNELDPTGSYDINTRIELGGPMLGPLLPDSVRKYTGVDVTVPGALVDPLVGAGRLMYDLYDNLGKYGKYTPQGYAFWEVADMMKNRVDPDDMQVIAEDMEALTHPTYEAATGVIDDDAYTKWLNHRDEELALYHRTPASSSIPGIMGRLGAEVLASVFIPLSLSKTVMGAATTGMALGGAQAFAFTRVPDDQSVIPYVMTGAIFGGALAAGFAKFGPELARIVQNRKNVNAADLEHLSEKLGVKIKDPAAAAELMNQELRQIDGGTRRAVIKNMKELAEQADVAVQNDPNMKFHRRLLNSLENEDLLKTIDIIDMYGGKATKSDLLDRMVARGQLDDVDTALGRLDDMEYESAKKFNQLRKFRQKHGKDADKVFKELQRTEKAFKDMKKAETMTEEIYEQKRRMWLKREQELMAKLGRDQTIPTLNEVEEIYEAADLLSAGQKADIAKFNPYTTSKAKIALRNLKAGRQLNQQGFVDSQILSVIAGGGVGSIFGAKNNEEDPLKGAIYGFLIGAGSAAALSKLGEKLTMQRVEDNIAKRGIVGTAADQMRHDGKKLYHFLSGWTHRKPLTVINGYGHEGRWIMHNMERARSRAEVTVGTEMTNFKAVMGDNNILKHHGVFDTYENVAGSDFRSYMQGELPNAGNNIKRAGEYTKELFKRALDESLSVGIMDKQTHASLNKTLKTTGYWPRIYNKNYLNTDEGTDKFVDALTSETFTKDILEDIVSSLIGKDHRYFARIMDMAGTKGKHKFVTRKMAMAILNKHLIRDNIGRSSRLTSSRKIHVEAERILNPFMVDDPMQVVTRYLDEVYREIENARHFGADDNIFKSKAAQIGKNYGTAERDLVLETYYTNVGDTNSSLVRAAINMPDAVAQGIGSASAWANLHLLFSQIINFNQAGVFGSVFASRHGFKGVREIIGASKNWLRDEKIILPSGESINAREWASMTGSDLESIMMNYVGEATAMTHTLIGNKGTKLVHGTPLYKAGGKYNPLAKAFDTLNEQTNFLRAIMFTPVEKMQRQLGALMGYRLGKMLYRELDFVLSAKGAGKGSKQYKKVLKTLDELGLPHNGASVSEDDFLMAGLKMSNKINFRNTAERIPLGWQHPAMSPSKRFKTFAYHTMDFLGTEIKEGNALGLGLYVALGATLGPAVFTARDKIRSLATGREEYLEGEDWNSWKRILSGMMTLGGMGLLMDTFYQAGNGKDLLQSVVGPTPSDLTDIGVGAFNSIGDDPMTAVNAFTKAAPPPIGIPLGYGIEAATGKNPLHKADKRKQSRRTTRRTKRNTSRYSGL